MRSLNKRKKLASLYIISSLLLILSAIAGVLLGSTGVTAAELIEGLFSGGKLSAGASVVRFVRLPRTIAAILCGAALSVSGAVVQAVLANRLASPSIIGVNSGAALAVTVCAALGIYGGWQLSLFSFLGAVAAVAAVSLGARRFGSSGGTVVLLGVAMNSILGAISDAVIELDPDVSVMTSGFRIGDFAGVSYARLIPAAVTTLVALAVILTLTADLDVLTLGTETATALGLRGGLVRPLLLMLSALLAASAVSIAGLISFVGLLVPHCLRRLSATSYRHLVPLSAIAGGGFVLLCDLLARLLFSPYEISVGIVMAFIGAPFFIFILVKGRGSYDA